MLARHKDEMAAFYKIIFQPGEEGVRGARAMVASGNSCTMSDILPFGHIGFMPTGTISGLYDGRFLATTKLDAHFKVSRAMRERAPEEGTQRTFWRQLRQVLPYTRFHGTAMGVSRINVGVLDPVQAATCFPTER
jgi:aminobenzoyl-glutamate utilization protein A